MVTAAACGRPRWAEGAGLSDAAVPTFERAASSGWTRAAPGVTSAKINRPVRRLARLVETARWFRAAGRASGMSLSSTPFYR